MMQTALRLALSFLMCFVLTAQAQSTNPQVKFVTSAGEFIVEVYPDKTPKTAENFLSYVRDGHYNGTLFHRVINNFMVQGGGYDTKYNEKNTRPPIKHEGAEAKANGGLRNTVGTLSMARTNNPHSASAQFFTNRPLRKAGAMSRSAKSSPAWMWSIASKPRLPALAALFRRMSPKPPSSFNLQPW